MSGILKGAILKRIPFRSMNIIVCGSNGKMGHSLIKLIKEHNSHQVVAGIDKNTQHNQNIPVFSSICEFDLKADVLIDFSHPSALSDILTYCKKTKTPAVICTTGLSKSQVDEIKKVSEFIPIFYSQNMSYGVGVLVNLIKSATKALGNISDIEIIEKHHNQKIDAPSGTALMLADKISDSLEYSPKLTFDRSNQRKPRSKEEIGIHSVRGGGIFGEHEVIFASKNEILTISHEALSRDVFSQGAILAAEFIIDKPCGIYTMSDISVDNQI